MTASYDYFAIKYLHEGLKTGFIYRIVPHAELNSIANTLEIDKIYTRIHLAIKAASAKLYKALPKSVRAEHVEARTEYPSTSSGRTAKPSVDSAERNELREWEVPFDFSDD